MKPVRFDARKTTRNLLKIGAAVAVIFGVGTAVVVWGPDGEVRDSQADIIDLDLSFGPTSANKRFGKSLERLGHDAPQAFDLNGNTVYFSVNYDDRRPHELMGRYQEEFAIQAVNDRAYFEATADNWEDRMFTGLAGGVAPQVVTRDYVTMGGVTMRGHADDALEVIRQYRPDLDESELFRGHRWVEMFWEPTMARTAVLASWSDDAFDYAKMVPGKAKKDLSVDPLVPACPGCTRVNRLRDLDRDRLHEANVFVTGAGSRQLEQFYHQAMTARGWSRRISNAPLGQVQQNVSFQGNETTVLSFYRPEAGDHRILTLLIYPIGQGQTAVHTTLSQSAHLATESE